mmetsp:Transcript_3590/g.22528  ORF Transcript_3590/g.22528 Transcript_3590/m.22528 type:complete len:197 (+) Transcript_3590:220-810(+)
MHKQHVHVQPRDPGEGEEDPKVETTEATDVDTVETVETEGVVVEETKGTTDTKKDRKKTYLQPCGKPCASSRSPIASITWLWWEKTEPPKQRPWDTQAAACPPSPGTNRNSRDAWVEELRGPIENDPSVMGRTVARKGRVRETRSGSGGCETVQKSVKGNVLSPPWRDGKACRDVGTPEESVSLRGGYSAKSLVCI